MPLQVQRQHLHGGHHGGHRPARRRAVGVHAARVAHLGRRRAARPVRSGRRAAGCSRGGGVAGVDARWLGADGARRAAAVPQAARQPQGRPGGQGGLPRADARAGGGRRRVRARRDERLRANGRGRAGRLGDAVLHRRHRDGNKRQRAARLSRDKKPHLPARLVQQPAQVVGATLRQLGGAGGQRLPPAQGALGRRARARAGTDHHAPPPTPPTTTHTHTHPPHPPTTPHPPHTTPHPAPTRTPPPPAPPRPPARERQRLAAVPWAPTPVCRHAHRHSTSRTGWR